MFCLCKLVHVEYIKTMKSSVLSTREFFQLTVNSLLELCTHCIDGHRIVSIEGRLLLALETGDKVELNIQQQDVSSLSTSVKPADTKKSSLVCYLHYCYTHCVSENRHLILVINSANVHQFLGNHLCKNSSVDEIANVNFFYDNVVHVEASTYTH